MKFLSLFSGMGGMDLGLERAGMSCMAQVELNQFCLSILEKRWPDVWRHNDVRTFCRRIGDCLPENEFGEIVCPFHGTDFGECSCIGTDQFLDEVGWPELIAGGDPCPQHSNARTHGKTPESLGGEFIRIVEQLRPTYVLRENPAAARKDAEWKAERFAAALSGLGYASVIFPVKACCVGLAHPRRRLFVFSVLQNADGSRLEGDECEIVAGAIRWGQNPDAAGPDRRNPAPRICRGIDGIPNRVDRLKAIGNAVAPDVAELIGRAILEARNAGGVREQKGFPGPAPMGGESEGF